MAKTASCRCCGAINFTSAMVKTPMPNRGNRNAYMCEKCATENESYHTTNRRIDGTAKKNAVMVGIEFETSFTDEIARNQMFEFGFIPTHDGSLESDGNGSRYGWDENTCEYVSGIWQGLNKASKFAVTAEKLISDGHMKINDSCGTHFHVSIDSMKDGNGCKIYMDYIRNYYIDIFAPLTVAMKRNPEATCTLFGRYFNGCYASSIDVYSSVGDRYNFINVTNDSNIEFRLNRFQTAKQYQNLMKMEVEMVKAIITNFCEHYNDTPTDSRRYPDMDSYRKHKAAVTANKLVKLFEKFASNM